MSTSAIAFIAGVALALLGVLAVKPLLDGEPDAQVPPIEAREPTPNGQKQRSHPRRAASRSRAEAPAPASGNDDGGFAPTPAAPAPAPQPSSPAPAPSPQAPPVGDDDLDGRGAASDDTGLDHDAGSN
jgi:hypothetical protein